MSNKGKNIGIAQPRPRAPRPNLLKTAKARFKFPNSVINSYYQPSLFGTPSSSNRKLQVYHKKEINKQNLQFNLEARVGQMDRLNRIKAAAMAKSSGKVIQQPPAQQPPAQQPPAQQPPAEPENEVGNKIDDNDDDDVNDNNNNDYYNNYEGYY